MINQSLKLSDCNDEVAAPRSARRKAQGKVATPKLTIVATKLAIEYSRLDTDIHIIKIKDKNITKNLTLILFGGILHIKCN